jgi:hypothetical protein
MTYGWPARIRTLILLLAFGIGLAGRIVPALAMSALPNPATDISMSNPAGCPGCNAGDSSMAMAPACAAAFCSVAPAITGQAPAIEPRAHPSFRPVAFAARQGLTVRPILGPPKPAFHS